MHAYIRVLFPGNDQDLCKDDRVLFSNHKGFIAHCVYELFLLILRSTHCDDHTMVRIKKFLFIILPDNLTVRLEGLLINNAN